MAISSKAAALARRTKLLGLLLLAAAAATAAVLHSASAAVDDGGIGVSSGSSIGAMEDHAQDPNAVFNSPFITIFKNGSYVRPSIPTVIPAGFDAAINVTSKDVVIDSATGVFVRVYFPGESPSEYPKCKKFPVVVYFHGGAFVIESAVDAAYNALAAAIAHKATAIVVSVEYRLAPEHLCPAAYSDCWTAVKWVASQQDTWIADHGDMDRLFLAGDSAGANIAHNMLMKSGIPKVKGGIYLHPWFDGEATLPGEVTGVKAALRAAWRLACPTAAAGLDDPRMNPFVKGAPSLAALGCEQLLVAVGGTDSLMVRGKMYYDAVTAGGWHGKKELFETPAEGHCFFVHELHTPKAVELLKEVAAFVKHGAGAAAAGDEP